MTPDQFLTVVRTMVLAGPGRAAPTVAIARLTGESVDTVLAAARKVRQQDREHMRPYRVERTVEGWALTEDYLLDLCRTLWRGARAML